MFTLYTRRTVVPVIDIASLVLSLQADLTGPWIIKIEKLRTGVYSISIHLEDAKKSALLRPMLIKDPCLLKIREY